MIKQLSYLVLFYTLSALALQRADFYFYKPNIKAKSIKEGDVFTHYFVFKNRSKQPLIIQDYGVNCKCTKLEFPKYPIPPNASDSVKLIFDSKGKLGKQFREVVLFSNAREKETFLSFKLEVK